MDRLFSIIALIVLDSVSATALDGHGSFSGNPAVRFLVDGRKIELLEPFSYKDPESHTWQVPSGYVSDGASIPRGLWTPIGGPLDGPYRDAAIVHDYYCEHFDTAWPELYKRDWKAVHRTFYEGMLARGVGLKKAQLMYAGVYYCGPRWEWNGNQVQKIKRWCPVGGDVNAEDIIADYVESGDRSLADIESLERTNVQLRQMIKAQAMEPQQSQAPQ